MFLPRKGYLAPPVVIILALITLAVAATLLFQAKFFSVGKNPSPTPQPAAISPQPTPKISPQPTPTTDETANWKTYTNTKYKFSFKYPNYAELAYGAGGVGSPLYVDENSSSIIVQPIKGENSYFGLGINTTNKSLDKIEKDLINDKNNTDFTRVKAGGYEAIRFNYYGSIPQVIVIKDGNEFEFDIAQDNPPYLDISNQILSTFKFTE